MAVTSDRRAAASARLARATTNRPSRSRNAAKPEPAVRIHGLRLARLTVLSCYHRDATAERGMTGQQRGSFKTAAYVGEHNAMRWVSTAVQRDRLLPIIGGVGRLKYTVGAAIEVEVEMIQTKLEIEYGLDPAARRQRIVNGARPRAKGNGIGRTDEFHGGCGETGARVGCVAVKVDRRRDLRPSQVERVRGRGSTDCQSRQLTVSVQ